MKVLIFDKQIKISPLVIRLTVILLMTLLVIGQHVQPVRAATVPSGFNDSQFVGGLSSPTAMDFAPDGRLFVTEKAGTLRVIKNGTLLSTPFLTVTVNTSVERGLLGITFDPNFTTNHYLYVYYTATTPTIHNRLSRFTANGDVAVPNSELALLDLPTLGAGNHNGGAIHFGPDGKLYIGVGENAVPSNAPLLTTPLGKLLRINPDGSIPSDNPFLAQTTGINQAIWAKGLRNPYTYSFQRGTGRLFINDVGQNTTEEIDDGIAGSDYGWPTCEGFCSPHNPSFRDPQYTYNHGGQQPVGCAITGGAFYNPPTVQFPASYVGKYFFADYCSGWIYYFDSSASPPVTATQFLSGGASIVDLKTADDGSLYYLQYASGTVRRIQYVTNAQPTITQNPSDQTVAVGQTASFTCSASGSATLTYQWQRGTVDIPSANSPTYTTPATVIGDNGATFRCVVSNSLGSATSNSATLTVVNRQPPTVQITLPASGTKYNAGQTITYAGTGSDAVDGTLPASAFSWTIVFHHQTHTHPFLGPINGVKTGTFMIPTTGETDSVVWYRVHLTVTNTAGLSSTTYVDVNPNKTDMTFQTNPPGLQFTLDGQPHTAPYTVTGVVGIVRSIGAVSPQTVNGQTYTFSSWSDSGTATHNINTPSSNTLYTITYQLSGLVDSIGVYRPSNHTFYLKDGNGPGQDITDQLGDSNSAPVVGDWDGDGYDSVGIFNRAAGVFTLYDSNVQGAALTRQFIFGNPNDLPISGRWVSGTPNDNVGRPHDGVGVYRPSNGLIYLASAWPALNGLIYSDYVIVLGNPNWKAVAGRWSGSALDTAAVYEPDNSRFWLTTQSCNGLPPGPNTFCLQFSNSDAYFGSPNSLPLKGDWTGQGKDGIGAYNPSNAVFSLLNNAPTTSGGHPAADSNIVYGNPGDLPLAGHWKPLSGAPAIPPNLLVAPTFTPVQPTRQPSATSTPDSGGLFD